MDDFAKEQNKYVISKVSPHSKALYEAGKKLLIDSIDTGKDFCKSMIAICTGAIPIYLALLKLTGIEKFDYEAMSKPFIVFFLLPPFLFLISCLTYILGYLPRTGKFSLDIIEEIDHARCQIIEKRNLLIKIGTVLFGLGAVNSIVCVIVVLFKI